MIVTVTWSTDDGVVVADTISTNDIVLCGSLTVTGVTKNPETNAAQIVATYLVAPPGGSWNREDNIVCSVYAVGGTVAAGEGPEPVAPSAWNSDSYLRNLHVNIQRLDPQPTAQTALPDITTASSATQDFTVLWSEHLVQGLLNHGTISTDDISITGPAGSLEITGVVTSTTTNATDITATYTFAAPAGGWSLQHNGLYNVYSVRGRVSAVDNAGEIYSNANYVLLDQFLVDLPARFFDTGFNSTNLTHDLEQSTGTAATFNGTNATFSGIGESDRSYLRTVIEDYNSTSFVAEVTVTLNGGGAPGIAFFGLGAGEPYPPSSFLPRWGPHAYMRVAPDDWGGEVWLVDNGHTINPATTGDGGDGTHRLQIFHDAVAQEIHFAIAQDYTGGTFVATTTYDPISTADNSFDGSNARIFFGGAADVRFDDLSIRPVQSTPEHITLDFTGRQLDNPYTPHEWDWRKHQWKEDGFTVRVVPGAFTEGLLLPEGTPHEMTLAAPGSYGDRNALTWYMGAITAGVGAPLDRELDGNVVQLEITHDSGASFDVVSANVVDRSNSLIWEGSNGAVVRTPPGTNDLSRSGLTGVTSVRFLARYAIHPEDVILDDIVLALNLDEVAGPTAGTFIDETIASDHGNTEGWVNLVFVYGTGSSNLKLGTWDGSPIKVYGTSITPGTYEFLMDVSAMTNETAGAFFDSFVPNFTMTGMSPDLAETPTNLTSGATWRFVFTVEEGDAIVGQQLEIVLGIPAYETDFNNARFYELHRFTANYTPVLSAYETWADAYDLAGPNALFDADPDGDGGKNGYEWATGTIPTNPASICMLGIHTTNTDAVVTFTRNTNATDVVIQLQRSLDLMTNVWNGIATNTTGSWTPPGIVTETGASNPVDVDITDSLTNSAAAFYFYRLMIDL